MPPDPPAQFHAALLATRAALLAQNTTASSASAVALAALAVAGAGAADCQNHLSSAQASFAVATFLDRALREASFAAANLAAAAEGAHAKAAAAATAMSAAATSIAAMGATFEQLLSTLNGVAAVATSNAEEDPIARAAKNVLTTFRSIGASVEELSYLSLQATIESARPATALAAQATRAGQARLPELLSSVEAGLKNAGAALAAAQNARASAMAALFEQSHARAAAAAEAAGLSSAIDGLDEICNQSLTAAVHNVPRGGDPQGTAGLRAAWKFSDSVAAHTAAFTAFGLPLLVGASRKRFINSVSPSPPDQRIGGSLASHLYAVRQGAAIVRVHDVAETVQALRVMAAIDLAAVEKITT